eukprot:GFUD01029585.1.p1 GENE.GFUD01029585.1~~GFUD01029585.1.p1  ORF type:complete len:423 (+),score=85.41 GFUD01029585.1:22-1290(+)
MHQMSIGNKNKETNHEDRETYEDPETIENLVEDTNARNDDIYEDPIDTENQRNETNDPETVGNQANVTAYNHSKENVYDAINLPMSTNQTEEDTSIKISKRCLCTTSIILTIGVIAVIGITVALTYTVTKKKLDNEQSKTCGDGWLNISSECFKFVDDACPSGCSWEHSVDICKDLGGKLAEPRTDEIMRQLVDHVKANSNLKKKAYWIGLTNTDVNGVFEWNSDKSPSNLSQTFWNTNEPTYDGPYVHTYPDTMLLNDRNDMHLTKPVCQKSVKKDTGKCDKDWIARDGHCYKFMTNVCRNGCTWSEAQQICNKIYGHLTEGPDFQFLRNVAKSLKLTTDWWIGFSDLTNEGVFVRETDGKYVDMKDAFATGEPNNNNGKTEEDCLEMRYVKDMKLNDKDCNTKHATVAFQPLCQKSVAAR